MNELMCENEFIANLDVTPSRALSDLSGKNIIVYDLEIKVPIEKLAKGWSDFENMGISVGCAFDYRDMKYRTFMDDNMILLAGRLNEPGTLIVAFNHIRFDNTLLRASKYPLKPDAELLNYDMMVISKRGAGCKDNGIHKGFRLDDHLNACKLPMKTANGAMAPLMWENKEVGTLVDYCLNDVQVERQLFEDMWVHGTTACAFKPVRYPIVLPQFT